MEKEAVCWEHFSQIPVRRQWRTPGIPPTDSSCAAKSSWVWGLKKQGTGEVGEGEKQKSHLHCKFIIINLKLRLL